MTVADKSDKNKRVCDLRGTQSCLDLPWVRLLKVCSYPLSLDHLAIQILNSPITALSSLHENKRRNHPVTSNLGSINRLGTILLEKCHDSIIVGLSRQICDQQHAASWVLPVPKIRSRDKMLDGGSAWRLLPPILVFITW